MGYKGVIFDLDGTLVNSLEDLADSMNSVLHDNKLPTHTLATYREFIGNGLRNLVSRSLPEGKENEILIDRFYKLMIEVYRNNLTKKTKPYDGITGLIDELVSRKIKLAVFSNKADEFTKKVVLTLLPDWHFDPIIGLTREEHKKPNPYCALQICNEFGLSKAEVIYVGDSGIDMQTANNAGIYAAGALWGFRTEEELISNGAKYLLHQPSDLIKLL